MTIRPIPLALLAVALCLLVPPPAVRAQGANPVPVIVSISPSRLPTAPSYGAFGGTVTVSGQNFVRSSVVRLNGTNLTTTFVSSSQLTGQVPSFGSSAASLAVFTPGPGGGLSNNVEVGVAQGGLGEEGFPVISVPPGLVRFEMALVGSYQEARLQVANALTGILTGAVTASAPFSCVSGCVYALPGAAVQDVTLRFSPSTAGTFPGAVSFSGAGGAVAPVEGVAALAPPTVRVTLNGAQFRAGQTVTVGIDAANPSGNVALRFLVGVVLPDGDSIVLLSDQGAVAGAGRASVPASLPAGTLAAGSFSRAAPSFFRFTFPPTGVASGTYVVFAAFVRDGALQDNVIGPGDIVALDSKVLTFLP